KLGSVLWQPALWFTERRIASLCAQFAVFGMCSQIWMPVTFVGIGLNSPRISTGALGFRSHMSCVGAPPCRETAMTLFATPVGFALAVLRRSAASRFGSVNPAPRTVEAPTVSASRRVMPSQNRVGLPSTRNMVRPPPAAFEPRTIVPANVFEPPAPFPTLQFHYHAPHTRR